MAKAAQAGVTVVSLSYKKLKQENPDAVFEGC